MEFNILTVLRRFTCKLAEKPAVFNFLRRIIEFNFVALKGVVTREFSLNNPTEDCCQKKFLDIPCGTGEFSGLFSASSYLGIDISPEYVAYAKKTYKRNFSCMNACKTTFDKYYFDNILMLGILHHLDMRSIISIFEEIRRILKKEGKILLIEDAPVNSKWNFVGKFLQRLDVGSNIRSAGEYKAYIERYFIIEKYYAIRSGFWDYSVFSLSLR